jgi:hypothetical protein
MFPLSLKTLFHSKNRQVFLAHPILLSHLRLCLPGSLFTSGFPTKISYTFLIAAMTGTCSALIMLIDLITVTIFDEKHKIEAPPHHRVQNGSGAHSASYPMGIRGSFPVGKAAGA